MPHRSAIKYFTLTKELLYVVQKNGTMRIPVFFGLAAPFPFFREVFRGVAQLILYEDQDNVDQVRSDDSESELLRRAAGGDTTAIHRLMDRHLPQVFTVAKSLVGNVSDAEDLVQDTFLAAMDSLSRFHGRSSFRTWLVGILVKQRAARQRREKIRRTSALPEEPGKFAAESALMVPDSSANADIRLDLYAALDRLSTEYREVLVLRELGGLSYDEIAAALGVPRGTVESRIHRARREIREQMKGYA